VRTGGAAGDDGVIHRPLGLELVSVVQRAVQKFGR
jgi:hypothetical protein